MKREIGVIIVLLILLLGAVQVALAEEYDLDAPASTVSEKDIGEVKQSLYFVPATRIANYPQNELPKQYLDAIYISDATGKPKYDFLDTDNIYLRDNRIDESLDEFFARTHQGYNIETQEFMPKYANLYEPNSLVDIYILFDQDLRESDLSDFFIPRSTPYGMESRALNMLGTNVVKKVTVKTTSVGRLPFVNLGKINIRELFSGIDQIGKGRTYDYSSQIDNLLRSDPLSRLKTPVRFDIFVDANRDMRWSWIGDLYQSNIVGRGWLREEPDAFLYGPVPGFTVRYNPAKLRSTCCLCEKGVYSVVNIFDVYECDEYCGKLDQDAFGWYDGKCEDAGLDVTRPEVKTKPLIKLEGLQFYTIQVKSDLTVPSMMAGTMGSKVKLAPTREVIAFSDETSLVVDQPLRSKDGEIFNIIPYMMDYNPINNQLLVITRYGEVFVIEIERGPNNSVYGKQIYYLERIWDSKIAPQGQRPFNSLPSETVMLDNGRIILKDSQNEDYTLIFKTKVKPVDVTTDEALTGIKFTTKEYPADENARVTRLVLDDAGNVRRFTDETGIMFDFVPKQIDYNPQNNILGILTTLDYIYIIQVQKNEFGEIVGEVLQEIRNVRERGLQFEEDLAFQGRPTAIDIQNSGDILVYDEQGIGFQMYLERDIFTDFDMPYDAVLLRGMHFGERPELVGAEELVAETEESPPAEPEAGLGTIEEVEMGTLGKPTAMRDALFLSLIILVVAILIIALLIFEFRKNQRP